MHVLCKNVVIVGQDGRFNGCQADSLTASLLAYSHIAAAVSGAVCITINYVTNYTRSTVDYLGFCGLRQSRLQET